MVVSAFVDVEAPGATSVVVRYGEEGRRDNLTPELVPLSDGRVTAVLVGLRPAATTDIEVEARAGGRTLGKTTIAFQTHPLPREIAFPNAQIVTDDGSAKGYVLGAFRMAKGKVAAILNRKGRVLWYRSLIGGPVGVFARLPNGNFVVVHAGGVFLEVDIGGVIVRRWTVDAPAFAEGLDSHEFLPLPNGRALVIAQQSSDIEGDRARSQRIDNAIVELDAAGTSRVVWSTQSNVKPNEHMPVPGFEAQPGRLEIAHANAIDASPDGQLLAVTCRELSQVLAIDRKTQAVVWRLGGKQSTLRILDDPLGGLSAPHDARFLPGNRVRVFDNGNAHSPPVSRVVIYEIDQSQGTARLVWQYRHNPDLFTNVGGSARALPGDRLLVNYGAHGTVTEVDNDGRVHWEMHVPKAGAYRIEWVPTLYPSAVR